MKARSARAPHRSFQEEVSDAIATVQQIRARNSDNDTYAVIAFAEAGFDPATIYPRQNVWTFAAFKAFGMHVRKNARAVRVPVWKPKKIRTANGWEIATRIDRTTGEEKAQMVQAEAFLFHVSQAEPYTAEELARLCKGGRVPQFLPLTAEMRATLDAAPVELDVPDLDATEPAPLRLTISYGSTVIHNTGDAPPADCEPMPLFAMK